MVLWQAVVLGVCVLMVLRRLERRSASLSMLGVVSCLFSRSWGQVLALLASSAMVMAVSYARFMVCLSGCDLISI